MDRLAGTGEDDLIVDMEQVPDSAVPDGDVEIEDARPGRAVASSTPDDMDDGEEPLRATKKPQPIDDEWDHEADDTQDRLHAAETRAREVESNAIMSEGRARAMVAQQQSNTTQVSMDSLQMRFDHAYNLLAQAEETGNTAAKIEIQRQIGDMNALKAQIEAARARIPDPRQIIAEAEGRARGVLSAESAGKVIGAGIQVRNALGERWARQNNWMRTNGGANKFVIRQSQSLVDEGWNPNSPSFYRELGDRVTRAFPKLNVGSIQAKRQAPMANTGMRTPVAPSRSSSGATQPKASSGSRYTLTASDQSAMKRFNLDPGNPAHRKAFAKSRIETARQQRS